MDIWDVHTPVSKSTAGTAKVIHIALAGVWGLRQAVLAVGLSETLLKQ